jgi:hypothetical protein
MGNPVMRDELDGTVRRTPARRIDARNGLLYEGETPLRFRKSESGFLVGCTFVTWEAFEEVKKRLGVTT